LRSNSSKCGPKKGFHSLEAVQSVHAAYQDVDSYHTCSSFFCSDTTNTFQGSRLQRSLQNKPPRPSAHQQNIDVVENLNDTQTGMLLGIPRSARCVQRFDDSLNSAIHITYRISLRSSSMREPRDPLLKVVYLTFIGLILNTL
jgi:hypothetical protein